MASKNAQYVDGFVIPVPKKKLAQYRKMAQLGCRLWMKHGALDCRECVGEDMNVKCGPGFPRGIKVKRGETVVFAYIVFKSRAHRDKVNAAVMKDPELCAGMDPNNMPFDWRRMLTGGFETLASA